jgi:hypothetical protein
MVSSPLKLNLLVGVLAAVAVLLLSTIPSLAAIRSPTARSASVPRNCQRFYAGPEVGDGEHTGGALQGARGVSCAKAWSLVRPNYRHVIKLSIAGVRFFTLGNFRCHFDPQGPVTLKICGRPGAVFFFA